MLNEKRASTKERWIGTYDEGIAGPLIFMMGGIHGNEKAGVTALEYLIKMLEVEPVTNENFSFSGRLVALRGNIQALQKGVRFVKRSEEHTSELQSRGHLVCCLVLVPSAPYPLSLHDALPILPDR